MEELSSDKIVLIDVGTQLEYEAGHIDSTIWIPRGSLEFLIQQLVDSADTPIVLYCRRGSRSALALKALTTLGYKNLKSLSGGLLAWAEAGHPLVNQLGKLKVSRFEQRGYKEGKRYFKNQSIEELIDK